MTATCATCGFDMPLELCSFCVRRAALVESRREAMRAWLDRGLTRPVRCVLCDEAPHETDPGMSPRFDGALVCVFCGYWGVPLGPNRDAIRARRGAEPKPWRDFEGSEPGVATESTNGDKLDA